MKSSAEEVLRAAERLTKDEREEIALTLLDGLEPDPGYEEAWAREIERRVREVKDGTVKLIPGHEMLAIIDAAVRGERRLPTDPS